MLSTWIIGIYPSVAMLNISACAFHFISPDINENDGESLYPRASNNAFSLAAKLANADTGKLSSLDKLLSSPFFWGVSNVSVKYLEILHSQTGIHSDVNFKTLR